MIIEKWVVIVVIICLAWNSLLYDVFILFLIEITDLLTICFVIVFV